MCNAHVTLNNTGDKHDEWKEIVEGRRILARSLFNLQQEGPNSNHNEFCYTVLQLRFLIDSKYVM